LVTADIREGDVVFIPDAAWNYSVWKCAADARSRGAMIVTMIHDLIPLTHPTLVDRLFTHIFRYWFKQMLACSDAIVCNSQATRNEVMTYCAVNGLPHPEVAFFHLGSDFLQADTSTSSACEGKHAARVTHPISAGDVFFLVVGSVEKRKRHDFLLDAFEHVWETHPGLKLVIVGRPGGSADDIIRRVEAHRRLGTNLVWLADVTDEQLLWFYTHARALVFCSAAEGYGLPLAEARQLGRYVIASDIPAFRELADAGVMLFPPQDVQALASAIREVADYESSQTFKRTSWTWADSTKQLIGVLTRLLHRPDPGDVCSPQTSHLPS
jgi:alpha-1,2-rhamnosyltransferase